MYGNRTPTDRGFRAGEFLDPDNNSARPKGILLHLAAGGQRFSTIQSGAMDGVRFFPVGGESQRRGWGIRRGGTRSVPPRLE